MLNVTIGVISDELAPPILPTSFTSPMVKPLYITSLPFVKLKISSNLTWNE